MRAFDLAWSLLKMPIVDNSFKDDGEGNFNGLFLDPESNEVLPLTTTEDRHEVSAKIGDRSEVRSFSEHPDYARVRVANTEPDYRQRGYATALYDAISYILRRHQGRRLKPDSQGQTTDGGMLWRKMGWEDFASMSDEDDLLDEYTYDGAQPKMDGEPVWRVPEKRWIAGEGE